MEAFVVRLWTPDDGRPSATPALRGTAMHVPSGAAVVFSDSTELLDFLSTSIAEHASGTHPWTSRALGQRHDNAPPSAGSPASEL